MYSISAADRRPTARHHGNRNDCRHCRVHVARQQSRRTEPGGRAIGLSGRSMRACFHELATGVRPLAWTERTPPCLRQCRETCRPSRSASGDPDSTPIWISGSFGVVAERDSPQASGHSTGRPTRGPYLRRVVRDKVRRARRERNPELPGTWNGSSAGCLKRPGGALPDGGRRAGRPEACRSRQQRGSCVFRATAQRCQFRSAGSAPPDSARCSDRRACPLIGCHREPGVPAPACSTTRNFT